MITVLDGFPETALGVAYVDHVTAEDYATVLVPEIEKRITQYGGVRLLVHFSDDFQTFAPSAMWSDTKLGLTHWSDFSRLAVVSDLVWLRDSVMLFGAFFPHPVKVLSDSEFDAARAWLLEGDAA